MKYLLFAGHKYYPGAGVMDLKWRGESVEDAKHAFDQLHSYYGKDWGWIVEHESMECIEYFECSEYGGEGKWIRHSKKAGGN